MGRTQLDIFAKSILSSALVLENGVHSNKPEFKFQEKRKSRFSLGVEDRRNNRSCLFAFEHFHVHHVGCRRSEEHTSELQSPCNLVCRLLLEKKKKNNN